MRAASLVKALALGLFLSSPAFALEKPPSPSENKAFKQIQIGGEVETKTLDNGMQVVVIPDHRSPVVTHMVWYKVGAADEKPGKSGIAHFLEHLMFKGTTNTPEGEFSQKVSQVGGQENAFTSSDYTAYYQQVAKEHLPMVMRYEADRMENLVLTDKQVLPERDVVLEERAMRIDNSAAAQLAETFNQMIFTNHPYGTPVVGWEGEIANLNKEDAIEFYNTYYTPNNAVLVVAGDVTMDEVAPLAKATYGKLERRAEPGERIRPEIQNVRGEREVTLLDQRVAQPSLQMGWVVPSYTTADNREAEALDIFADILGGGTNSRLYKRLVVEEKLATSAGSWYNSTAVDDSQLKVFATPADSIELSTIENKLEAAIADIAQNGVTNEEVERSKRSMLASAIYAQDKQSALARLFGATLTTGGTVEDVQSWPENIMSVTPKMVQSVAQKYIQAPAAKGYLLPAPAPQKTSKAKQEGNNS
ncbi:M16 family metallopeptidase [Flexibacterium corallicola]|uniref:M16 family metallopeptidase n=1 Tax=Flexibacterium corallicola TaxID=3037259 RepID=UPI00286FAA96|nr:pitrilysin family protein [Pseudovibrio sp. M1P-2-3]